MADERTTEEADFGTFGKADFRAEREALGLSIKDMAEQVGVAPITMRRWEKPREWSIPPDVRRKLAGLRDRFDEACDRTADGLETHAALSGNPPGPVVLPYYRDEGEWEAYGPGIAGTGLPFGFANAVARECAAAARALGIPVRYAYARELEEHPDECPAGVLVPIEL